MRCLSLFAPPRSPLGSLFSFLPCLSPSSSSLSPSSSNLSPPLSTSPLFLVHVSPPLPVLILCVSPYFPFRSPLSSPLQTPSSPCACLVSFITLRAYLSWVVFRLSLAFLFMITLLYGFIKYIHSLSSLSIRFHFYNSVSFLFCGFVIFRFESVRLWIYAIYIVECFSEYNFCFIFL